MNPKDILVRPLGRSARVVFAHPYDPRFVQACKALKLRGLLSFGENPIEDSGGSYKAWYADIKECDAETYGRYAMLVRGFYTSDLRAKFDALFADVKHDAIEASVHNPSAFMEANRAEVDRLVAKWKDTKAPLEFYGSLHQAEGVALFLQSLKTPDVKGFVNCDAPGLGKTRQALVAAVEAGFKNILIVTTKTAKVTAWPDELALVDPKGTVALIDHKNYNQRARWTIIHWDCLRLADDRFFDNAQTFDLIIIDEAHYASNENSQRGKAIWRLAEAIPKVWPMTGTPVTKRPKNVIQILRLVHHPIVNTKTKVWNFLTRYCGDKDEFGYWDFDRAKNIEELHVLLRDVFIRREKDQTNLPEKLRFPKVIKLTDAQRRAYDSCWEDYCAVPENKEKMGKPGYPYAMVEKTVRRHAVAMLKVPHIIEWAEELIDAGEKVVIFTSFDNVWEAYAKHFGARAVGIRGGMKPEDVKAAKDSFQNDPEVKVFIGNIIAAGEAVTLTAASYLAHNDITWLPKDQMQGEDRIHRGGAVKTCMIYYFLTEGTTDESGFQDFLRALKVTQTIVNRRDENNKPIDPGFAGEIPAAANPQPGEHENPLMRKLARLIDTNSLKAGDLSFADSIHKQFLDRGFLTSKQTAVVGRIVSRYRERLKVLGEG
jgi:SWI/SNF-related matrix-associated actin-dependent regulator 1 of chromatin subfamily A